MNIRSCQKDPQTHAKQLNNLRLSHFEYSVQTEEGIDKLQLRQKKKGDQAGE